MGQVAVSPRREHFTDSLVQFSLGDTVLDERSLKYLNYLLAVSSGRPQAGVTFRACRLVSWAGYHRHLSRA